MPVPAFPHRSKHTQSDTCLCYHDACSRGSHQHEGCLLVTPTCQALWHRAVAEYWQLLCTAMVERNNGSRPKTSAQASKCFCNFYTNKHNGSMEQGVVMGQEQGGMAYLEHFLLAGLGNSPLPFQLSLSLMPQASNLLRTQHAGWLPHAL